MLQQLIDMANRIAALEERFGQGNYATERKLESSINRSFRIEAQSQTLYAPLVGYCVSTIDPLNLNRVRIYHPLLCQPDVKVSGLPFARNCTNTGGIDDCGGSWVPPAGSSVLIVCENGDRQAPIVIGTVWQKNRGPQASKFPYPIDEFYKLWRLENYRGDGYLFGKTDGSQAYPPWSSESMNNQDFDNEKDIDKDPDAQQKITYANIYGWKTPGKHYIKMVDGDYRCNNRWARFEIMSKTGHWFIMKDDWFHPSGDWANPKGACDASGSVDDSTCDSVSALLSLDISGVEDTSGNFTGQEVGSGGVVGSSAGRCTGSPLPPAQCSNPYAKRYEESRPFRGSALPMRNKMELPQSGIHSQSVCGHQWSMDDAVNQPREGRINWRRVFDTGCDDKLKCKFYQKSATGHMVLLDDTEDDPQIRSKRNGIRIQSANGNYLYFRDHTTAGCIAGDKRGIKMGSTSGHELEFNDNGNEQCAPTRRGFINKDDLGREADLDPRPIKKAKQAFIQMRSGYGLLLRMDDSTSQEETRQQFIMLAAIPKNATGCNDQPHTLLMQLEQGGGGFVELTSGGKFVLSTRGDSLEGVGTDSCPANKLTNVFGSYLIAAKNFLFTKSVVHLDLADKYIILGAGQDCPIDDDNAEDQGDEATAGAAAAVDEANASGQSQENKKGPCIYPIIIAKDPQVCPLTGFIHWMSYSNRVLASSGK